MKLTIITPCSRPGNLPRMKPGIDAGRVLIDIDWRVVFDTTVCSCYPVTDGAIISGISVDGSHFGNGQRNAGIDATREGWIYFLDDDNAIHPKFFQGIAGAILTHPDKRAFAFQQSLFERGNRDVSPADMRANHIDMAQVLIHRDLIGSIRFELDPYNADGRFIEAVYQSDPGAWGFIHQTLCYYNALR